MWNVKKEIAHHEKMIGILEMIETLNNRILGNIKYEIMANENDFFGMKNHYKKRLEIDTKIKSRLVNYYSKKKL